MERFRKAAEAKDPDALIATLADDVVFRSPALFKPVLGIGPTGFILRNVLRVFENFRYVSELAGGNKSALEFVATIGDREVNGIDLITVGPDGQITELAVFIRPLSSLQALVAAMSALVKPQ